MSYLHDVSNGFEKASFGMGCFWGCDSVFGATLGVLRTRVGYSGGKIENPTYKKIGDHTEVIEIEYDPTVVSFKELLDKFWLHHEFIPTEEVVVQYSSVVLYHNEDQKKETKKSMESESLKLKHKVVTQLKNANKHTFYPAEDYHQKYRLQAHPKLVSGIGLTVGPMLQTSHLAARLNGYIAGFGGIDQFNSEVERLGLTEDQADYVRKFITKNADNGPSC